MATAVRLDLARRVLEPNIAAGARPAGPFVLMPHPAGQIVQRNEVEIGRLVHPVAVQEIGNLWGTRHFHRDIALADFILPAPGRAASVLRPEVNRTKTRTDGAVGWAPGVEYTISGVIIRGYHQHLLDWRHPYRQSWVSGHSHPFGQSEAPIQSPDFHVFGRHVMGKAVALLHPGDQLRLGPDLREIRFCQASPLGLGVPHIAPSKKIIVLIVGNILHSSLLDYRKLNYSINP
jgi:hypothetical protein